jgi:hypothetical protein
MLANFSGSVTLSEGRTVDVHPLLQIVSSIVDCVTAGFNAPGVHLGSGSEYGPDPFAWQEPGAGCGWITSPLALDTTRARATERCFAGPR